MRYLRACFSFSVLLLIGTAYDLRAQSAPCPPSQLLLSSSDPAYADALQLKKTLEDHGFRVYCTFETKFSSMFSLWDGDVAHSTILGEACLRTDLGDIDAVFLPSNQTFAEFQIKEQRKGDGYIHKTSGTPRMHGNVLESARRQYFLKDHNRLLLLGDDTRLLTHLEHALGLQHESL